MASNEEDAVGARIGRWLRSKAAEPREVIPGRAATQAQMGRTAPELSPEAASPFPPAVPRVPTVGQTMGQRIASGRWSAPREAARSQAPAEAAPSPTSAARDAADRSIGSVEARAPARPMPANIEVEAKRPRRPSPPREAMSADDLNAAVLRLTSGGAPRNDVERTLATRMGLAYKKGGVVKKAKGGPVKAAKPVKKAAGGPVTPMPKGKPKAKALPPKTPVSGFMRNSKLLMKKGGAVKKGKK